MPQLKQARAEQAAAEAETAKLEQAAARARTEAERSARSRPPRPRRSKPPRRGSPPRHARLRLASAYVAAHRQRLAEEQRPVASLLAGLAMMARRPPLLAFADEGGTDDLVKVRLLLDSTLPVIRQPHGRAVRASSPKASGSQRAALAARAELVRSRDELVGSRRQFAALEQQRTANGALASGGQALGAGDVAIAAGEDVERLRGAASQQPRLARSRRNSRPTEPAPPQPVRAGRPAPRSPSPISCRRRRRSPRVWPRSTQAAFARAD